MLHSCDRESTLSTPTFANENQERSQRQSAFDKGIWYYSGLPLTDHHDLAGIVNPNRML